MKKLPIGIQSFEEIRKGNYYYADKTYFVSKLVESGKYYFLSRPRRFGKSLFLDTIRQAFLGKKELFEGLYLEKNWDWSVKYPVIYIDFGGVLIKDSDKLISYILQQLHETQNNLGIVCENKDDYNLFFRELIIKTSQKYNQKVVVLVDEYDKPILDKIENREEAIKIRDILKNFYSVLKPLDVYLKFVFLTGVSKFSKVSLFSGLNQLRDITISPEFSTICGYTQSELETVFSDRLKGENLKDIKEWYNGYSWLGETVYNPFDILLYLQEKRFHPYWFETGTPTFLIKLLIQKRFYIPQLDELIASENLIGSFDVDAIEPENLLFQTGYLTIKDYEDSPTGYIYTLTYPNKEVKISLNNYITSYLTQKGFDAIRLTTNLYKGLKEGKIETLRDVLKSLFASIPYEWYRSNDIANYEGYYANVIYSFLAGAGFNMIAEDYTSKGRIDLTIIYEGRCYIIEFKVVELEPEGRALNQLKEKKYADKYIGKFNDIYLVGIEFSKDKKDLVGFEWERVE
ncbi:MAG: ATP-binding protein [Hydrogenothermaceae bacterium]|nr:ATP-binding protein [Hydrogenothermaceae bacterium]